MRKRICVIIPGALFALMILMSSSLTSCAPVPWHHDWMPFGWTPFLGFPVGLFGLALYLLPTIIAAARHHPNLLTIVLINFFLGWTVVGWIITLIWSFSGPTRR